MKDRFRRLAAFLAGSLGILGIPLHATAAELVYEMALTRALVEETLVKRRPARIALTTTNAERAVGANPLDAPGVRVPPRSASRTPIEALIDEAAVRHGVSPAFVHAIVSVESAYNTRALSPKGAMGLMQLMPGTAAALGVADPWNPRDNVSGGVRFIADLLGEFGSAELALTGYNAGPEVVRRGRRVPDETRAYVRAVMARFNIFRSGAS